MLHSVPYEFNPNIFHPTYLIKSGLYRSIKQLAPKLGNGRLLDLGCGIKPYKSLFNVSEYIGVEYYGEGETYSKDKADFFYDGKTLPFEDKSFDSVFCSEVFEHVFNLEEILRELSRVLKPGGKMLLTFPFVYPEHEVPNDYARYTHFAATDLLKKSGFQIVVFKKAGSFSEVISQLKILHYEHCIHKYIKSIPLLRSVVRYTVYSTNNICALIKRHFFQGNREMYLSNIVLAEKAISL